MKNAYKRLIRWGMMCLVTYIVTALILADMALGQLSIDEICLNAQRQAEAIKNARVEYEYTCAVVKRIPGVTDDISTSPYRYITVYEGERRVTCKLPKDEKEGKDYFVFDGESTADCHIGIVDGNVLANAAFLSKGKVPRSDQPCFYLSGALGIPICDSDRANFAAGLTSSFPACVRNRPDAYHLEKVQEVVDGHPCYVIDGGTDKMWIDPNVNYWYRKRERRDGDRNAVVTGRQQLSDFREVSPGVWAPMKASWQEYCPPYNQAYSGQQYFQADISVTRLCVNCVTDADFAIRCGPGMHLVDLDRATEVRLDSELLSSISELKGLARGR